MIRTEDREDAEITELAKSLVDIRRKPWLMPDHIDQDSALCELPIVKSRTVRGDHPEAVYKVLLEVVETILQGRIKEAVTAFFNLDEMEDLVALEARNNKCAQLLSQAPVPWSKSKAHITLMRHVARGILSSELIEELNQQSGSKSSPSTDKEIRRGLSPIEFDNYIKAMQTLLGRGKRIFMGGILYPWCSNSIVVNEPREYSVIGLLQMYRHRHRDSELINLIVEREAKFDSVILQMVLNDSMPIWRQRFKLPTVWIDDLDSILFEATHVRSETDKVFDSVKTDRLGNPRQSHMFLEGDWKHWLDSCRCPANQADDEEKSAKRWTELSFEECDVHGNLWIDDIIPYELNNHISIDHKWS